MIQATGTARVEALSGITVSKSQGQEEAWGGAGGGWGEPGARKHPRASKWSLPVYRNKINSSLSLLIPHLLLLISGFSTFRDSNSIAPVCPEKLQMSGLVSFALEEGTS